MHAHQVTAFGGDRVINLLQAIERNHRRFRKPPIGPIGSHVVSFYSFRLQSVHQTNYFTCYLILTCAAVAVTIFNVNILWVKKSLLMV